MVRCALDKCGTGLGAVETVANMATAGKLSSCDGTP
jgi:hypothetical protein